MLSARTKKNGCCVDELKKEASESPFQSVQHNQDTYGQTEMIENVYEVQVINLGTCDPVQGTGVAGQVTSLSQSLHVSQKGRLANLFENSNNSTICTSL